MRKLVLCFMFSRLLLLSFLCHVLLLRSCSLVAVLEVFDALDYLLLFKLMN